MRTYSVKLINVAEQVKVTGDAVTVKEGCVIITHEGNVIGVFPVAAIQGITSTSAPGLSKP